MKNGQPQRSDARLFMQLLAFGGCSDVPALVAALAASGLQACSTKTSTIRAVSRC